MGNVSKITCRWFQMRKNTSKFHRIAFNEKFIKNYNVNSDIRYIQVDLEYPQKV